MKLYLIRHGETDWNIKKKIQGTMDIELNSNGRAQAKSLGEKIVNNEKYKFNIIYSSKKKRALETAYIIASITKATCIPVDNLHEVDFGLWQGHTFEEVKVLYPEEYNRWVENKDLFYPPKGESYGDCVKRVLKVIKNIVLENQGKEDAVAIVTHGAVIMSLQCYIKGISYNELMRFRLDNTAIVEIDSDLLFAPIK